MHMEIGAILGLLGTVSGILIAWIGLHRSSKALIQQDTKVHAKLESDIDYIKSEVDAIKLDTKMQVRLGTDIEYIKDGIDAIKKDLKSQDVRVTDLYQDVIRIEASTKSAHKRIDKLERRE